MRKQRSFANLFCVLTILAAAGICLLAMSPQATAVPPGDTSFGTMCPDIVAPVICSNGKVYINGCYAARAGATGCRPYNF